MLVEGEIDERGVSKALGGVVVAWSVSTAVDQIWLRAWNEGRLVRELLFNEQRWSLVAGEPCLFENHERLLHFLRRTKLLASPDGYEVLNAFLGVEQTPSEVIAARDLPSAPPTEAEAQAQKEAVEAAKRLLNDKRIVVRANDEWGPQDAAVDAKQLSRSTPSLVVHFSHQALAKRLWLVAYEAGEKRRELAFGRGAWLAPVGEPLEFENSAVLAEVMRSQEPDAEKFFSAFLGQ